MNNRFFRPLGTLCILAALPMIEAGIPTARSFFRIDALKWLLASLGTLGAFVLLAAGILLFAKRLAGCTVAYWEAGISILSIIFAFIIRLAGGHALLYGVGYPIVIVHLLRGITASDGVSSSTKHSPSRDVSQDPGRHLRSALA